VRPADHRPQADQQLQHAEDQRRVFAPFRSPLEDQRVEALLLLDFAAAGARVIGISPDEVKDVDKFAGKHDLDFTLLADADHAVAEKYGTWVEKSMYGNKYMGVQRATFIIDAKGKIAKVFPKVQPKKHDDLVLKALGELAAA
jgi:peroxiredoxin Q/BCP